MDCRTVGADLCHGYDGLHDAPVCPAGDLRIRLDCKRDLRACAGATRRFRSAVRALAACGISVRGVLRRRLYGVAFSACGGGSLRPDFFASSGAYSGDRYSHRARG